MDDEKSINLGYKIIVASIFLIVVGFFTISAFNFSSKVNKTLLAMNNSRVINVNLKLTDVECNNSVKYIDSIVLEFEDNNGVLKNSQFKKEISTSSEGIRNLYKAYDLNIYKNSSYPLVKLSDKDKILNELNSALIWESYGSVLIDTHNE